MSVEHSNIADYEAGREYSRDIHSQIETVNNAVVCLRSQGCPEMTEVPQIAPGTTPSKSDIMQLKSLADKGVSHLYDHHYEKERIIKDYIELQQLCVECLEQVYEE